MKRAGIIILLLAIGAFLGATGSITLQPGETEESINITWYSQANDGTPLVRIDGRTIEAEQIPLLFPTKYIANEYRDLTRVTNKATITGLLPDTTYTYRLSDDGERWSKAHRFRTPGEDGFVFAFIADAQQSSFWKVIDDRGWNPRHPVPKHSWDRVAYVLESTGATLLVSGGDQTDDYHWGRTGEYNHLFAPDIMASIPFAPSVGNHDRTYMFTNHFNLPNEQDVEPVYTTAHNFDYSNYVTKKKGDPGQKYGVKAVDGVYDFIERRQAETVGNYFYLYCNVLFVTLNNSGYPSSMEEGEAYIRNFRQTLQAAVERYSGEYDWLIVTYHKPTIAMGKHIASTDVEYFHKAGLEDLMDEFSVDFVLSGHNALYSRSYVIKGGMITEDGSDSYTDPDGTIYIDGNCAADASYSEPFDLLKKDNEDYPLLADGSAGSKGYLSGTLPFGVQVWNQEYSPGYMLFRVDGRTISAESYILEGDSRKPGSKLIDSFTVTKT